MADYMSLKSLADELGLDRSHLRKYVLKQGFNPIKIRTPDSGGQLTLALRLGEAKTVQQRRQRQGFSLRGASQQRPQDTENGFFYLAQLVPDIHPNRIKVGFATDVQSRLAAHRTSAPTSVLVKTWGCKRLWERAAIDSITRKGCKQVGSEVYDCESLEQTAKCCDEFFALMPHPGLLPARALPARRPDGTPAGGPGPGG